MSDENVVILLGVYGDAIYLAEQLQSLARQSHGNWSLLMSFDGMSPRARAEAERFAASQPERRIELIEGQDEGFATNYLSLLARVPDEADYIAFCDHDDVWVRHRLKRALNVLRGEPGPAMICGRTMICDENLRQFALSPLFRKEPGFANALVQNIGGGNTMVFNRAALELLAEALPHAGRIVAHDWWSYQVLTGMGAKVIYDPEPVLLFRQHGGNVFGSNATLRGRAERVMQFLGGRFRIWSDRTVESLWPLRDRLTPQNRQVLEDFQQARKSPLMTRLRLMRRAGIARQTPSAQLLLWLAVVFRLV